MADRPTYVWTGSDWDTIADPGAVRKSLVSGKGSLIAATADDTPADLPVGSNGQMLMADSSATAGLRYVDPPTNRNLLINGQMLVWQRGAAITGINSDGTYTADRWFMSRGGNVNVTKRSLGSYNPPAGFNDYAEILNKTASNPFLTLSQALETSTCIPLRGKEVTLSFYARAAANTTESKTLLVDLVSSTSTDTKTGGTIVGSQVTYSLTFGSASTDWQRFSFTRTVPSDCSTLRPRFSLDPAALAVDDGFHITGVQLEVGPVATPFEFEPFEATLRKCQRYYYLHASGASKHVGLGAYTGSAIVYTSVNFPTTMRTEPSLVVASGTNYYRVSTGSNDDVNDWIIQLAGDSSAFLYNNSQASGTTGQAGTTFTNNASASIAFSAEL